jgi:type I restriction enzyme M protein
MKEGTGRVGVVMPHGVLFRGGKEAAIREAVLRSDLLEAVISLPTNLFYSTSIPVCILVFRKAKRAERKDSVLIIDATKRFQAGKNQNVMDDNDISVIDAAYQTGVGVDGGGGLSLRLVPFTEIEANGFDLNIGRYIRGEVAAEANVGEALSAMYASRLLLAATQDALDLRLRAAGFDV